MLFWEKGMFAQAEEVNSERRDHDVYTNSGNATNYV